MRTTGQRLYIAAILAILVVLAGCASNPSGTGHDELQTSSDQTDSQKRARTHLQLAIDYFEHRQMNVALDEIKQTLSVDPDLSDAYSVRALIYMDMGETRLAEENFQHAMRLSPNNPDLSNNYGWFLCRNGHPAESITYFEAALKNHAYHSPAKALNNAGVCSSKLKDSAAAERYFMRAFKYEPGNPSTSANLAKIYYDRHDYERARFYIGRVTKADVLTADVLWLAIKIEHKLGGLSTEVSLATQLRRRHPDSPEYAAYQRGAFDE
ncbi:MAG TPA: type IV pilus biogenesis/stability protein PilW [Oxalobacteraceae bacterium]|jgi:type IV pilus assembly protein PilF|nr:type IV pilus biogenesis/stability protein PilW [Oxalobacteraceae bacterium]HCN88662.1 type IV pilus biogenesis/stability protein PilW [Oxalobacteraceae bacterium]